MESTEAFFDEPYKVIKFTDSLERKDSRHVAHCIIFCSKPFHVDTSDESKAYISMHMRSDGYLGFPGGLIEKDDDDIVCGLNREMQEEINLQKKYFVTDKDHHVTCINEEWNYCFHSFAKEVSETEFKEIERNALHADDKNEVLGLIRVPLFTKKDGCRGFPTFLLNCFAGCAKQQLLNFLVYSKLMSYDEIKDCLSTSTSN